MSRKILAACAMSAALVTTYVLAQEEGGGGGGAAFKGPAKATADQLANPNYHPPAKKIAPTVAFLATIKPTGATPRMSDGHPDLSGMWTAGFPAQGGRQARRSNGSFEADQMAVQRTSWWNKPVYKPELWEKVVDLDYSIYDRDPGYACEPLGMPRGAQRPVILMNTQQAWIRNGDILRIVPLDGRKRNPDDEDQSFNTGIPIGHWDGDTMVIESVGFDDKTWIGYPGYFHSDQMSLVERFTRDGNVLYYQYTLTDPEVLMQPYTSVKYAFRLNPNANAVPGPLTSCNSNLDTDRGIYDKYFRG